MEALQLVFFAALAAVVLFQLYSILGRRVGRQPEDAAADEARRVQAQPETRRVEEVHAPEAAATGLAALKQRDPSFDTANFLAGARTAYEMIVIAFAKGDRAALRGLLTPGVLQTFEGAITAREAEGRTEAVEFLHAPRADLEDVEMNGDVARVKVRFLSEFRTRSRGPEGEAVDDRRTAEFWTFERNVTSRDPNWALAQVEPAEV
ncbi:MAG: TIM44-related membrane protein TimA [Pseudomonadota bacterium]|nr:TIM44-related membrane protein TimA [Pseudomonadota bacterium]